MHELMSISSFTLLSDTKIQIGYYSNEFIVNYIIGARPDSMVQIEVYKSTYGSLSKDTYKF
jgi:hypothetical protein